MSLHAFDYRFTVDGLLEDSGDVLSLPRTTIKRDSEGFQASCLWLDKDDLPKQLSLPHSRFQPGAYRSDEAWSLFAIINEPEDFCWFIGPGNCPAVIEPMAMRPGMYYVFSVDDVGVTQAVSEQPHKLLAMAEAKRLIEAGKCPLVLVHLNDAMGGWNDRVLTAAKEGSVLRADERFSSLKGSVASCFEVIGFRPGYSEWAELLVITDDLQSLRDTDLSSSMEELFCGFETIRLLSPGDIRPADVIQTDTTHQCWLGSLTGSWLADFAEQFDAGKFSTDQRQPHA